MIDQREEIAFAGAADHVADIRETELAIIENMLNLFDAGFLIPVLFALRFFGLLNHPVDQLISRPSTLSRMG